MNIIPKSFDIEENVEIKHIIETLQQNEQELQLVDSQVFLEFPLYKDDDNSVVMTQVLIVSPSHGVIIIYSSDISRIEQRLISVEDKKLDKAAGHITAKLMKNDQLRSGLMGLAIPIDAMLFTRNLDGDTSSLETRHQLVTATPDFIQRLRDKITVTPIADYLIEETISSLQGAKGLLRPKERNIDGYDANTKVAKVHIAESRILRFDNEQQDGYIPAIDGPHRIRGLAGSGKTVILAMKVVQTLLRESNHNVSVLYTFSTKSLYQHVKRLIHRFFREFHDDLSYLDCVKVLHAWGGATNAGVYYNACISHGVTPLTLTDAQKLATRDIQAFEVACKQLLETVEITPQYDYVFVDEAQDYGKYYLQLCTRLAKNNRVTFGSDVFQNIFQPKVISANEIFSGALEFKQDDFLETCYRTPLAVLVAAHSIGLGVYGEQVQIIDSVESWHGFGYEVLTRNEGDFNLNEEIIVQRSETKSPTLVEENPNDLIRYRSGFKDIKEEANFVANQIVNDIHTDGLLPEDIMVICVDDRSCSSYFTCLDDALTSQGIQTNNVHANKYSINDFHVENRVTLSTVHKAKGNEAYSVYIVGCDALCHNLNLRSRNLLFTAMTRTKGWLYITSFGDVASDLFNELTLAQQNSPEIRFTFPSAEGLERIKTDLKEKVGSTDKGVKALEILARQYGTDELEKMLVEMRARQSKRS
jgi:superfamily I DNA and RNA helicase